MKGLYCYELKRSTKPLLVWALCAIGLLVMGWLEYAFVFRDNADIGAIMGALPPSLAALLGITSYVDFSTAPGFYCLMADFVFYVLAAYAVLLGAALTAREETEQTCDFLFSRPISRGHIMAAKWTAGATCCTLLGALVMAGTMLTFGRTPELLGVILMTAAGNLLMEFVYLAAGALFAALCRRPGRASVVSLVFLLVTILDGKLMTMLNLPKGPLTVLSARDYFPAERLLYGGGFGLWPWAASVLLTAVLFAAAFWRYRTKDL